MLPKCCRPSAEFFPSAAAGQLLPTCDESDLAVPTRDTLETPIPKPPHDQFVVSEKQEDEGGQPFHYNLEAVVVNCQVIAHALITR